MAARRQPLARIQDENAEINRGKTNVAKSGGLKVQQTDLSDRKTLSTINNKLKALPNLGTATPSAQRNSKGGFSIRVDPELSGKSGVKGRTVSRTPLRNIENVESSVQKGKSGVKGRTVSRTPLRNIENVESAVQKGKSGVKGRTVSRTPLGNIENVESSVQNGKTGVMGPNPRYEVTEAMKEQAEIWAREGIEKCHFTGKDMDALSEKMAEEEVNRRVAQALSYRSEIPCWLPSALVKPAEIKDCLELIPEEDAEDVFTNVSPSFKGMEQQDIDYDEWCLDICTAPNGWPAVIETIDI